MSDANGVTRSKATRRSSDGTTQPDVSAGKTVAATVQRRLSESSYAAMRGVTCECEDGILVLRGIVPSFNMKQLAQEIVRKVEGVDAVVNDLEVED